MELETNWALLKNHLGMRAQIFPIFTFHFGLKQIIKKIIVTYIAKELLVNLNREGQHVKKIPIRYLDDKTKGALKVSDEW